MVKNLALALVLVAFAVSCGDGGGGSSPAATAPPPPTPPATPTNLRVTAQGGDWIEWSWNAVAGADGYQAQFSDNEVFTGSDPIFPVPSSQVSYRHRNLSPGTTGYLRVRATRAGLTSAWSQHRTGMTEIVSSFINWEVEDSCFGGVGLIEVRFHRFVSGQRFEAWPSLQAAPYEIPALGVREFRLQVSSPRLGGEVCLGARDLGPGYWGVDLDGTESCDWCCIPVPSFGTVSEYTNLTCGLMTADGP